VHVDEYGSQLKLLEMDRGCLRGDCVRDLRLADVGHGTRESLLKTATRSTVKLTH